MKRKASMASVLALCAALAMTGAVAAKDPGVHGNSGAHASGHAGGNVATSLKIKGNASHPGGVFRVLAVLHAAKDFRPATIDAVVHFRTGDVSVVLTRSGQGAAYHGNVPVPAGEPAGIVMIDGTAVVNGATLTATGSGKIVVETTETSETTTETSETTTTETSTTCTATTTETATTTVTDTSTATETTEADESSESSESAESSETSESSESDDSESCDGESDPAPSFVVNPQTIREFVALLAALLN